MREARRDMTEALATSPTAEGRWAGRQGFKPTRRVTGERDTGVSCVCQTQESVVPEEGIEPTRRVTGGRF